MSQRKVTAVNFQTQYSGSNSQLHVFTNENQHQETNREEDDEGSQKKLPVRTNRGLDATVKKVQKKAFELAKRQLHNRFWLVYFEDNTCQVIWSKHNNVRMDMVERTKVEEGSIVDVKYTQKNPNTDSFYWTGTVISIGGEEFIKNEAKSAHVQVTQNNGDVALIPVVQREDPDMTAYENISQIIMNEDAEPIPKKKIKFVTSHRESALQSQRSEPQDENESEYVERNPEDRYVSMDPEDVSKYLNVVEEGVLLEQRNCHNTSEVAASPALNVSSCLVQGKADQLDQPKHSSTPANRKMKRAKTINPEDLTDMEIKRADLEAATAMKEAADKIMHAAEMIVNCMQELKPEIKSLANRNYREIQMSTNAVKQLTAEIGKLGVMLPTPKSFDKSDKKLLPITVGPGIGEDLALVEGVTAQIIGRNASKKLWTRDELKQHMLSPKLKTKLGVEPRTDFSPVRKELFKDLFRLKFEDRWLSQYELAKISLNNVGNEIRSSERRSLEARNQLEEAKENNDPQTTSNDQNPTDEAY